MHLTGRLSALLWALLIPAIVWPAIHIALIAGYTMGRDTQMSIWIEGSPRQLQALVVVLQPQAGKIGGKVTIGDSSANPLPKSCSPHGQLLVWDGLRGGDPAVAAERVIAAAARLQMRACSGLSYRDNPPASAAEGRFSFRSGALITAISLVLVLWLALQLRRASGKRWNIPGSLEVSALSGRIVYGLVGVVLATGLLAFLLLVTDQELNVSELMATRVGVRGQAWILLAVGVLVPAIEEVAFRGWMLPIATRFMDNRIAVAITAAVFALGHVPSNLSMGAFYFGMGVILGWLWVRTRSLLSCVITHGTWNTGIALLSLGI